MNSLKNICKKNHKHDFIRPLLRRVSALYITRDKAKDNCTVVTPYMNVDYLLAHSKEMEINAKKRQLNIDVESILRKYEKFRVSRKKLEELQAQREAVTNEIKKLNAAEKSQDNLQILKEKGKNARIAYKAFKEEADLIQDDFILDFLNLPNELHSKCPKKESDEVLLYRNTQPLQKVAGAQYHLERKDLIKFTNNTIYYLEEEAAEFDIKCTHDCSKYFIEKNFVFSKNPDFTRRVLMDASCTSVKDYHMVMEKEMEDKVNTTHLTGGGSFQSFLGFMTKLSIEPSILPFRLVTFGRRYKINHDPKKSGLYAATQTNAVCTFVATDSAKNADLQMDEILNLTVDFYKTLGICFQIRYVSAPKLSLAESLRATIEVYSPVTSSYIEVGSISNYSDFISKRILFNIRENQNFSFPHMVGGPILLTTPLIAALIENNIQLSSIKLPELSPWPEEQSASNEFKSLFK